MNLVLLSFTRKTNYRIWPLVLVFIFVLPLPASFKEFYPIYNFAFGTKALSMGNAFTAVADDLTAVFWNPAGLADFSVPMAYGSFRSQSMSSAYDAQENIFPEYTQSLTSRFESTVRSIDFASLSVPALFWNVKWNFALSYCRYIPYNAEGFQESELKVTGDHTGTRKTELAFSGESGIDIMGFSMGVDFSKYIMVGITLQYFFNSGRVFQRYESDDLQYDLEITEELNGQNIIIGGLFKPDKSLSLAMVYQTGFGGTFVTESRYTGSDKTETTEDTFECDIRIPPRFALGIMICPQESWRIAYDFSKVLWKSGTIRGFNGSDTELPFPVRDAFPINQLDNLNHRLGMELDIKFKEVVFHVRGGVFWERQLFTDAYAGKVWLKGFSLGLGMRLLSKVELDLAYMKQNATWRENGYFDPELQVENHYRNHILSLALTYMFIKTKK